MVAAAAILLLAVSMLPFLPDDASGSVRGGSWGGRRMVNPFMTVVSQPLLTVGDP